MARLVPVILALIVSACSSSVPTALITESTGSAPLAPPVESAGDAILREQKQKLNGIRREYDNCKDLGDYARMMKLARARRAELDAMIRRIHKMKLSPEEHERLLNPLRQERDWHLQVLQVASQI